MLRGRTVVVTGSTSGIGHGIATAFAQNGCNVVLNGFAPAGAIPSLTQRLEQYSGARVLYHPADLSRAEECAAIIRDARQYFGAIDVLVNNAGMQYLAPIDEFPPERWDAILALNLSAAFHTTRVALPLMREQAWGRIINIASVHGLVGSIHKAAYVAAKHGLIGLTKVVALETASQNITCNAICPGFVLTPLIQEQIDALATQDGLAPEMAMHKLLSAKQPSLQFTTVEQIAELALFLCGDSAANITGTALPMDGGWTAQ